MGISSHKDLHDDDLFVFIDPDIEKVEPTIRKVFLEKSRYDRVLTGSTKAIRIEETLSIDGSFINSKWTLDVRLNSGSFWCCGII